MRHSKKFILFLYLITCTIFSYAIDSTQITPMEKPIVMHRTASINTNTVFTPGIKYTAEGHQVQNDCKANQTLIRIKHESKLVYWGPPESVCIQQDYCTRENSSWDCVNPLAPLHCSFWCDIPCRTHSQVRWQARPKTNQVKEGAIRENMPSVLSEVSCAPIETNWEQA